jgi:hypothetical protein
MIGNEEHPVGDELPPVLEPAQFDPPAAVPGDVAADDSADDAAPVDEAIVHAAVAEFDAKTLDLLHKLCEHFGVPHHGDVHATARALGEFTGHSLLDTKTLIHELAEKSGHR